MIIPTEKNIKTVTDLREKTLELLRQTKSGGPTIIFHHSKPMAVMLSIDEYTNMAEMLEDYLDIQEAKERETFCQIASKTAAKDIKRVKKIRR